MALYSKDFSKILSDLVEKNGITNYQINQYSGLDQGYLSRLRAGQANNPSPETVVKIGISLAHCSNKITLIEIENLFNACGRSLQKRS